MQASLAAILYASDLLLAVPARPRRLHAFVRRGSHGESKRGCALAPVGGFVCQVFGSVQRRKKKSQVSSRIFTGSFSAVSTPIFACEHLLFSISIFLKIYTIIAISLQNLVDFPQILGFFAHRFKEPEK